VKAPSWGKAEEPRLEEQHSKKLAEDAAKTRLHLRGVGHLPTDHEEARAELTLEERARKAARPKTRRWRDLLAFDKQLAELEQRRAVLLEDVAALNLRLQTEPAKHTAELASWMEGGEKGARPVSRVSELQAAVADRQAEYDASGLRYDQLLEQRAEHVARNRKRFVRDARKAKEKAAAEYKDLINAVAAKRSELLEHRASEVWAGLYPSDKLGSEPNTQALAGARKGVQGPLLPGVEAAIPAEGLFELLRHDASFCGGVSTLDQAAAIEGKTPEELQGREAGWQGDGKTDYVGPRFEAAWSGTPEEKREADRVKSYSESLRRRLRGE
jgi:hypothetical protein